MTKKTGVQEWAKHSRNIMTGCINDCKYCYAREMALRFKRIKSAEEWCNPVLNEKAMSEKPKKLSSRIMFPTTHDLFEEHQEMIMVYLYSWLEVGNEFLITTKPNFDVIRFLCNYLEKFKDQITFRFTIGSTCNEVLKFWEPNAPLFAERLHALEYAFEAGYKTSVSVEPILDQSILHLFECIDPYVTDTIWFGFMRDAKRRVDMTGWGAKEYDFLYRDDPVRDNLKWFYDHLSKSPKVRWKDSIRKLLDLPDYEKVG